MPDELPPTEVPAGPDVAADPERRAVALAHALSVAIGAGLILYGLFLAVQWLRDEPAEPVNAGLIIGFSAVWGIALLACAQGLRRRRRWARAPIITSALLLVTVGWLLASGHGPEVWFGALILALAVACLVSLLRPTLSSALR